MPFDDRGSIVLAASPMANQFSPAMRIPRLHDAAATRGGPRGWAAPSRPIVVRVARTREHQRVVSRFPEPCNKSASVKYAAMSRLSGSGETYHQPSATYSIHVRLSAG